MPPGNSLGAIVLNRQDLSSDLRRPHHNTSDRERLSADKLRHGGFLSEIGRRGIDQRSGHLVEISAPITPVLMCAPPQQDRLGAASKLRNRRRKSGHNNAARWPFAPRRPAAGRDIFDDRQSCRRRQARAFAARRDFLAFPGRTLPPCRRCPRLNSLVRATFASVPVRGPIGPPGESRRACPCPLHCSRRPHPAGPCSPTKNRALAKGAPAWS